MTYWTLPKAHPGGTQFIKKRAENSQAFLIFPNSHSIDRWSVNKDKFPYLGKVGDTVLIRNLPDALQIDAVIEYYSDATYINTKNGLVCGSSGVVSINF